MAKKGDKYVVEVKRAHIEWGVYRHSNSRDIIRGESYVKIPSKEARRLRILRGTQYIAHFTNGSPAICIKASGNGPMENGYQYAKQFEGVGAGACKAFTPWYQASNVEVGDLVLVEFLSSKDIEFSIIKK